MMKSFTVIAIFAFALLGCTKHEAKPFSCLHGDVNHDDMNVIKPIPIDTGILRDKPIDIIFKELFLSRLESSSILLATSFAIAIALFTNNPIEEWIEK